MKVLVINCGSSSIKYRLFEMPEEKIIAMGMLEKIGDKASKIKHKAGEKTVEIQEEIPNHEKGLKRILGLLEDKKDGVVKSISEITAVGHRVVHGGEGFPKSTVLNDKVIKVIEEYVDLAPLHNPPNLAGIKAAKELLPKAKQVGAFDTAFHQTIPKVAYIYPIPYEYYEKYKVRKYGFHGTSHRFVARRAAELMKMDKYKANIVTCHLGNGCSIAAIKAGKSVDTSMGMTPLEGLVMGTRSGDLDPAIIFYLAGKEKKTLEDVNNILNKKSGLLGISGVSNDVRNIEAAAKQGNERAKLALDIFCYRVKKYIGAYTAIMGHVDAVVFTGGIGENAAALRTQILSDMEFVGITLDKERNENGKEKERMISTEDSRAKVFVIPTDEEVRIAVDTYELTKN